MKILIAVGHITGAIVLFIIIGIIFHFISYWERKRNEKSAMEELCIRLGLPESELLENLEKYAPKIKQISLERFNDDLFKNRFSDFCGLIRTAWNWLGDIISALILIAVIWYTFTDNLNLAVNAWLINVIGILFFIASVIFAILCKLLTGRYPGQAKAARKELKYLFITSHKGESHENNSI